MVSLQLWQSNRRHIFLKYHFHYPKVPLEGDALPQSLDASYVPVREHVIVKSDLVVKINGKLLWPIKWSQHALMQTRFRGLLGLLRKKCLIWRRGVHYACCWSLAKLTMRPNFEKVQRRAKKNTCILLLGYGVLRPCLGYALALVTLCLGYVLALVTLLPRLHFCLGYTLALVTLLPWLHSCLGYALALVTLLPWSHSCLGHTLALVTPLPWSHSCLGHTLALVTLLPWSHSCLGHTLALVTLLPWLRPCLGHTLALVTLLSWLRPCLGHTLALVTLLSWLRPCLGYALPLVTLCLGYALALTLRRDRV